MKVKSIVGVLAATAAMSLMCVSAHAATYSAGAVTSKAGETVSVPVKVAPSEGESSVKVNGYIVEVTYDSAVLTPVVKGTDDLGADRYATSAVEGGILTADKVDVADTTTDKIVVGWADATAKDFTAETILANVEFTINANATVESTPIGVKVVQAATDANTLDTTYTVAEGSVTLGKAWLYGDVDNNGTVDSYDASLVLKYDLSLLTFTADQIVRGDVDGSGAVDSYDASLILKHDLGLLSKFPVEG